MKNIQIFLLVQIFTLIVAFPVNGYAKNKSDIPQEINKLKSVNAQNENKFNRLDKDVNKLESGYSDNTNSINSLNHEVDKINLKLKFVESKNKGLVRYVESAYKHVDWWLAFIAIAFALAGIGFPLIFALKMKADNKNTVDKINMQLDKSSTIYNEIVALSKDTEIEHDKAVKTGKKIEDLYVKSSQRHGAGNNELNEKDNEIEGGVISDAISDNDVPHKDRLMALSLKAYHDKKWLEAIKYFNQLKMLEPDNVNTLLHLAYSYSNLAHAGMDAAKNYSISLDIYNDILHNSPDNILANINAANTCINISLITDDKEKVSQVLDDAEGYLNKIISVSEDKSSMVLMNLVSIRLQRSIISDDLAEKEKNISQAEEYARTLYERDEKDVNSARALVTVLCDKQRNTVDKNARRGVLREALDLINGALLINDKNARLINLKATVLLESLDLVEAKDRSEFLSESYKLLMTANNLDSNISNYNLACYYSIIGYEDEAKYWLEKHLKQGFHLPRRIIVSEKDFDFIKNKDWFDEMMGKYFN